MKIMMLGWELPPYNSGGLGVACFNMAKALADAGAEINFILPKAAKEHKDISFMTVTSFDKTSIENIPIIPNAYENTNIATIRALQDDYVNYIRTHAHDFKPDIIHAHDWLTLEAGVEAKKITGAPLIAHVHATEFDRAGGKSGNPIIHEVEQQGLLMADRIIAVSQLTRKMIIERYDIPADKIEVNHNSINKEDYDTVTSTDLYMYLENMKSEGWTVVSTIGRLTVQKGLTHFLRAAAKASGLYDRFLFVIAGDGEQRDELIQLSADLGIADKVVFTGFVRGEAWRQLNALTDIFVMSSVSEPFGLTALEAAAHDTALVLTKQSGVIEVMNNVLAYDYWDETLLADQLVNIALSDSLKQSLREGAREEFEVMSWADVAKRCMQTYQTARAVL